MFATVNHVGVRTHDALKASFKKPLSAVEIAAMKANVEGNFKVAFSYSGAEFNYMVVLEGTEIPFKNAMSTLFPKGRPDIIIQRASSVG